MEKDEYPISFLITHDGKVFDPWNNDDAIEQGYIPSPRETVGQSRRIYNCSGVISCWVDTTLYEEIGEPESCRNIYATRMLLACGYEPLAKHPEVPSTLNVHGQLLIEFTVPEDYFCNKFTLAEMTRSLIVAIIDPRQGQRELFKAARVLHKLYNIKTEEEF